MNSIENKLMRLLAREQRLTQRELAAQCSCSLGLVNRSLKALQAAGYLSDGMELTPLARQELKNRAPQNAVILAAGFGMRMIPINMETPKAFLEVHGEPLIERTIRQLHEAGVTEIHVVVGFMKEQFEYLIDRFGVDLIVNPDYAAKNNLHSLALAEKYLGNTYIIPSDLWCRENPYHPVELQSWYMVTDAADHGSTLRVNRSLELVRTGYDGSRMVGISYLTREDAAAVRNRLEEMDREAQYDQAFWEETLLEKNRMCIDAEVVPDSDVVEINTYEQLRELDSSSAQLRSKAISFAAHALHAKPEDIREISVLKKGMTNRSFLFSCHGTQYIMRIPGEGTDQLINRTQEAAVYAKIGKQNLCDEVICIDPKTGYKITKYLAKARVCDPANGTEVAACMQKLRDFHGLQLQVDHSFDLFGQLEFYESLWQGVPSAYRDYRQTKERVLSLRPYIEAHRTDWTLCHIDSVPDNFLLVPQADGSEQIRLIDWEYAGMQDPCVDLAMFCIYALYDRAQVDQLIAAYFEEGCARETRIKIYCYIAVCGLLWSNWCEYKRNLGVEFGEYSLRQYRYAKDYYRLVKTELGELG